jgi:peroxiredoxin
MKRAVLWMSIAALLIAVSAYAQQLAAPGTDNSPKLGAPAPDFKLPMNAPAPSLKELAAKKRVLLMFFPAAFSPGCTTEFTEAGQQYDKFTAMNIEIIGISRDLTFAQNKFKETVGAKNTFVSDPDLMVTTEYDAVSPQKLAKRYYFLVDQKGNIAWKNVTGQLIPTEKLLGELAQVK